MPFKELPFAFIAQHFCLYFYLYLYFCLHERTMNISLNLTLDHSKGELKTSQFENWQLVIVLWHVSCPACKQVHRLLHNNNKCPSATTSVLKF